MSVAGHADASSKRATVIGTGLIGGSIGLALRARGWHVTGTDLDASVVDEGIALGAFDAAGFDPTAALVVVATPVGAIPGVAQHALRMSPNAFVTDVGGVKGSILAQVSDSRFIGGHPMAGSEQLGLEGATGALFEGAAWVLTPAAQTGDATYEFVRDVVISLGADVLTLDAAQHDALVAVVSHVPHLTAAALVAVAAERAEEHRALLMLAAGGFRDMTRVAAGSPDIWPDVCTQNRDAIVSTLDRLIRELERFRSLVEGRERTALLQALTRSQRVRRNLPSRDREAVEVVEVRVPIANRPGEIAAVAVLATDNGINLRSLQTIDAAESAGGVLSIQIASSDTEQFRAALVAHGYAPVVLDAAPDGAGG